MSGLCTTCYGQLVYYAVGECDHHYTCHQCYIRGIMFYDLYKCHFCRTEMKEVVITNKIDRTYEELKKTSVKHLLFGKFVYFLTRNIMEYIENEIAVICTICSSNMGRYFTFRNMAQLKHHLGDRHALYICDTCSTGRKVFSSNFIYYNKKDLNSHLNGDRTSKEQDIPPHTKCPFCESNHFYNQDDLDHHCEEIHVQCNLCFQVGKNQFFRTIDELQMHQRQIHFLCTEHGCEMVFSSEYELRIHLNTTHKKKDSNRIDFSSMQNMFQSPQSVHQQAIEKPIVYLVEDPSGWTLYEIEKKKKELDFKLLVLSDGNIFAFEKMKNLIDQCINDTMPPEKLYSLFLKKYGIEAAPIFGQMISLVENPDLRRKLEILYRKTKEIYRPQLFSSAKVQAYVSDRIQMREFIQSEKELYLLQFHDLFCYLFSILKDLHYRNPIAPVQRILEEMKPENYMDSLTQLIPWVTGSKSVIDMITRNASTKPLKYQMFSRGDRDKIENMVGDLPDISHKILGLFCTNALSQLFNLSQTVKQSVKITADLFPSLPSRENTPYVPPPQIEEMNFIRRTNLTYEVMFPSLPPPPQPIINPLYPPLPLNNNNPSPSIKNKSNISNIDNNYDQLNRTNIIYHNTTTINRQKTHEELLEERIKSASREINNRKNKNKNKSKKSSRGIQIL